MELILSLAKTIAHKILYHGAGTASGNRIHSQLYKGRLLWPLY